jgi:hypothetical protein
MELYSSLLCFEVPGLTLMLSISDPTLPPYYVMSYYILIACASDDWDEADLWRRSARQVWSTNHAKAVLMEDYDSLEVLDEVRSHLEALDEQQLEEFTDRTLTEEERGSNPGENVATRALALVDEYMRLVEQEMLEDVGDSDSEDQDVGGFDFDDQDEGAAAENAE